MIALALLLAAGQVATPAMPLPAARTPGTPPQRIVLSNCPDGVDGEIVVCGTPDKPRLPLPDERGPPDGPRRPTGDPRAALDAGDPGACALRGCQAGVDIFGAGTAAIRLVGKLIDPDSCCERPGESTNPGMLIGDAIGGLKRAFGRKPDKSGRVAISLDDPPRISSEGRLLP
ncbi:hypothetical protein GCM10022268_14530 [Sphingomonas cynarae]|uniref:Uncharacterized protein n=2 Tax=Sphingomonas cynarae TaxID=930197 RepID=A0ABP7DLX7_9SPHN